MTFTYIKELSWHIQGICFLECVIRIFISYLLLLGYKVQKKM